MGAMRRIPALVISLTAISALGSSLLAVPAAQAAPASVSAAQASPASVPAAQAAPAKKGPRASLKGTVIQQNLFGMHVFNLQDGVWPTVPVGSIRLWDNETTWSSIETAQNQFNWTKLDTAV